MCPPIFRFPSPRWCRRAGLGWFYPFPWAVVRWLPGQDAMTARVDPTVEAARTLGRFVTELQSIDVTNGPFPGSEGFVRGLPLAGRNASFRAALEECDGGLVDVVRVEQIWNDALAASAD